MPCILSFSTYNTQQNDSLDLCFSFIDNQIFLPHSSGWPSKIILFFRNFLNNIVAITRNYRSETSEKKNYYLFHKSLTELIRLKWKQIKKRSPAIGLRTLRIKTHFSSLFFWNKYYRVMNCSAIIKNWNCYDWFNQSHVQFACNPWWKHVQIIKMCFCFHSENYLACLEWRTIEMNLTRVFLLFWRFIFL